MYPLIAALGLFEAGYKDCALAGETKRGTEAMVLSVVAELQTDAVAAVAVAAVVVAAAAVAAVAGEHAVDVTARQGCHMSTLTVPHVERKAG
jgi:hypothetical protein